MISATQLNRNKMKITLVIFSLITFTTFDIVYSQNLTIATEPKTINYTNGREIFNICKSNQVVTYYEDLEYYWYNDFSKVKSTKGGAGGNLLHGKYQFFDENGNLINQSNYYLGLKDGVENTWDTLGLILQTYKFSKGKLIYSKYKSKESDNIIEWNGPALHKGSIRKIYTSYGRLEETAEVLDKALTLKITEFFYNGKIKRHYTKGIADWFYDEYIEYFENGKIKVYGKFDDNWKIGDWIWYKEDGTVDAIEKYRINIQYNADNKIISKGGEFLKPENNEWVRNGLWIWYKENGEDWEDTIEYEYGVEVNKK
jgi:antitoxin component YwqK of YwqJK toxin-antitoxin module